MNKVKKKLAIALSVFLFSPLVNANTCQTLMGTHWKGTLSSSSGRITMNDLDIWNVEQPSSFDVLIRAMLHYDPGNNNIGTEGVCTDGGDFSKPAIFNLDNDTYGTWTLQVTYDPNKRDQLLVTDGTLQGAQGVNGILYLFTAPPSKNATSHK